MRSKSQKKPRTPKCWECGKRLRSAKGGGLYYVEIEVDSHKRIMHVQCAGNYKCMDENNGSCSLETSKECNGDNTQCRYFLSHYMTKKF